jgi:hypothetical protein
MTTEAIAGKVNGVMPAQASADGSAFLFYAAPGKESSLSQFNNGRYAQFYRYDVASKALSCISCPPQGVVPTAPPEINFNALEPRTVQSVRRMSADGTRIFFESPDPLLTADTNGHPDVYEWENGHLYLISGGTSTVESNFFDSSESGNDVFFATEQGLLPSDEDEATDIYDARVPRPDDNPPPAHTPCSGEVCQGPPSVPQLLTPAASATFEGLGDIPPEAEETATPARKPPVKCKRGLVRAHGKCVKKKAKKRSKRSKRSKKSGRGK